MHLLIVKIIRVYNEFLKKMLQVGYAALRKAYRKTKMNELTFDHEIDVFLRWPQTGQFHWGGVAAFNLCAIHFFEEPSILELGCSDGFYPFYFYRHVKKSKYLGVDLDSDNLKIARKRLKGTNCTVINADFLLEMPNEDYSNVIWCESINMFSLAEQERIIKQVAIRLKKNRGILSGTGVLRSGGEQWKHYIYLFDSKEELRQMLSRYFLNVFVYTRDDMPDNAILFMASDGKLPFDYAN